MAYLNDLGRGNLAEIERRLRRLEHKATLTNAAIGRDGMEVYDQGILNISNGTLIVNGFAQISGSLEVSGTSTFSGSLTIAGPTGITGPLTVAGLTTISGQLTVTGPTKLNGKLDIGGNTTVTGTFDVTGLTKLKGDTTVEGKFDVTGAMATKGTLSVEGITTLKNHLNVDQGKRITLGGLMLENQGSGTAQVNMPGGSIGASIALGMSINHNTVQLVGQQSVTLDSALINLNAPQTSVNGKLVVTGTAALGSTSTFTGIATFNASIRNPGRPTTGNAANVHMNAAGYFYEVTSSKRFKLDVQPLDLPDSLLDVPIVDWIDLPAQENHDRLNDEPRPFEFEDQVDYDNADLTRIPGALAEDVEAAGGQAFVTYGDDGLPRALAYDRFALARTALLLERIKLLEKLVLQLAG